MSNERYFQVLVTRDCTESALIPVVATGASAAGEKACSRAVVAQNHSRFAYNDGSAHDEEVYLGSDEEDVEEITKAEYETMLAPGAAPSLVSILQELIADIERTGGIVRNEDGNYAPAADEEWSDLAITVMKAHRVLNERGHGVTLSIED
jgi:hypothetical protein